MGKYQPLSDYLTSQVACGCERVSLGFGKIEEILGFSLPYSARTYPAWWANESRPKHSHARSWLEAGWHTQKLDLGSARVQFAHVSHPGQALTRVDGRCAAAGTESIDLLEKDPDKVEAFVSGSLQNELSDHLEAARCAYDLVSEALRSVSGRPLTRAFAVCVPLMIRLCNDLRAAMVLTGLGYPAQANAVVAGMFEVAYTATALDSDPQLVDEWLSHDDPTRLFRPVRWLMEEGLRKIGMPASQEQAAVEYQVYSQLCMLKHAHPRIQMTLGVQVGDQGMRGRNGPDLSEQATRASRFALESACGLACIALAGFLNSHVPSELRGVLGPQVERLCEWRNQLQAASAERYGTEDPFPGKWRG